MKSLIPSIRIIAATLLLVPVAARATDVFTYNNADVLLVFRQSGEPNLEVDLGPVSQFINASPGSQISITNFGSAQLQAAYTNTAALYWAVISDVRQTSVYNLPVNTLFLTDPRTNAAIQTTPYTEASTFQQASIGSLISTVAGYGSTEGAIVWSSGEPANAISNTPNVVIIPESDPSSYTSIAGTAGNLGGNFNQGDVENLTPSPFVSATLSDFYELEPGSSPGTYLGYFQFDPNGNLSFTAAGGGAESNVVVSIPSDGSEGCAITYTVAVQNNSPDVATNVVVTDTLPDGTTFVSAAPSLGTTTQSLGVVTWNLATLSNGASATAVIQVTAPSNGEFIDAVSVDYPGDPVSSASATVTVSGCGIEFPDLSIVKVTAPKTITLTEKKPSETKSAQVEIANDGTGSYTITTLSNLVTLTAESLTPGVPNADVTLVSGRPQKSVPLTLKPKGKLSVVFDVTFNETTNSEFRYLAGLNGTVVSNASVEVIVQPVKK